jgi:hypothetical protein
LERVRDKHTQDIFSQKVAVGSVVSTLTIASLGHMLLSLIIFEDADSGEYTSTETKAFLEDWYNKLDESEKRIVRVTLFSIYQLEPGPGNGLRVFHNIGVNVVGHSFVRPVIQEGVIDFLPWDNILEESVAAVSGFAIIQGYWIMNEIRRCRAGEITNDQRNESISGRAGITAGAAVGQTIAIPVAVNAGFLAANGVLAAGLAVTGGVVTGPLFAVTVAGYYGVMGASWLACTMAGGALGKSVGQKVYHRIRGPKDWIKDAREYFSIEGTGHVNDCDVEKNYRAKVEMIESNEDQSKKVQMIYQCNVHLVWLLEGMYPGAKNVLGLRE